MGLLDGKVAIITGAGGGIGRQHALLLAKEGAKVVVNDLGGDRHGSGGGKNMADETAELITSAGGAAVANYGSVATREGADSMVWTAMNKFKRVDILVNNAGILRDRSALNMDEAEWDLVHAVHLKGTFLCSQAAARVMKVQGSGGRIINTSSLSGLLGNFGQANYSAAKAGIAGLTFTLAMEFQRFGVTVNAIAPVALTRMTDDLPMMQGLDPDDVGPERISPPVLFLASDLAADVSGKILGVQGARVFEYKVVMSEGVSLDAKETWTPEMIKERWGEIVVKN